MNQNIWSPLSALSVYVDMLIKLSMPLAFGSEFLLDETMCMIIVQLFVLGACLLLGVNIKYTYVGKGFH